jgi:hypothetical protein
MMWKLFEIDLWKVFRQNAKCQEFWIVLGWERDVELRR